MRSTSGVIRPPIRVCSSNGRTAKRSWSGPTRSPPRSLGFRRRPGASGKFRTGMEVVIIIVDHHLDLALALSDRTVALERGQVQWTGESKALRDDLELRRKVL